MRLADYEKKDGKKVWLSQDELNNLIGEAKTPEQKVALMLGGKAGLRRSEIASVTRPDFVTSHGSYRVRVWNDYAKRDKYREVPVGEDLWNIVDTISFDREPDESIVGCHSSTIWDWVRRAAERRQAATGDKGWSFLDCHDLRRTWGTYLVGRGVIPSYVMQVGGWDDWETFRNHYIGEMSPEVEKREIQKIPWLADGQAQLDDPDMHTLPVGSKSYGQTD